MDAIEYRARAAAAITRGYERHDPMDEDLSRWPVDVQEVVQAVCRLWHLRAPAAKKSKALWIADARELMDACGEFGNSVLEVYRGEFEAYMAGHGGIAQHTVSGPGSLVKMVRSTAARMRSQPRKRSYSEGRYAEFIEH